MMKNFLNASAFDVFTVIPSGSVQEPSTDIRFAAHGSPYYAPEKLEGILANHKKELQDTLNVVITMIHIDECLIEGVNCPSQSCANELNVEDQPQSIFTNTTSFVGVQAIVNPVCKCSSINRIGWQSCQPNPCLNGGSCEPLRTGSYKCNCPADNPDQFGPNCEILAATYNGQG